ncbi:ribbon-helix-helix protein, CopG family [Patescibacteria group bacterium]|nr:ribbon-helix-helix protein, CopG family [Patescibacteria group bacterium]
MAKKRVTFSLSPDAIKLLKEVANEERRSQSNMIEILIYERMKKK